ncbi:MAG: hypoxanthine phosphoribosyltransferase [Oscillospiraceae bacterium]|jgi:hypoxanthine phosphoribosyltransferase|nr:hypoxanthine phosphoribosyltransferase [Oscillospiraceae bacterium]
MNGTLSDQPLARDLERVLLSEETIRARVREMGARIDASYGPGEEPLLVGILKGACVFLSDLLRAIPRHVALDFISTSSYGAGVRSSGQVRLLKDLDKPVEGRHILLVEDIIDSGLTMSYLKRMLLARRPASIRIATLLDKPSRRKQPLTPDYVGFEIDDLFVVGYGLDFDERYRNLPVIGVLKPACYQKMGEEAPRAGEPRNLDDKGETC